MVLHCNACTMDEFMSGPIGTFFTAYHAFEKRWGGDHFNCSNYIDDKIVSMFRIIVSSKDPKMMDDSSGVWRAYLDARHTIDAQGGQYFIPTSGTYNTKGATFLATMEQTWLLVGHAMQTCM